MEELKDWNCLKEQHGLTREEMLLRNKAKQDVAKVVVLEEIK